MLLFQIRITGPGKTRNYIAYATGLLTVGLLVRRMHVWLSTSSAPECKIDRCFLGNLQQKGCSSVELKAMGQAINKTVTIGEDRAVAWCKTCSCSKQE